MNTKFSLLLLLLLSNSLIFSQLQKPKYFEAFPQLLFSEEQIKKSGFQKVLIWYDEYEKGPEDQPGMLWSVNLKSYQYQRHNLPGGEIENSIIYDENNNRISALNYYYRDGVLSAIDEVIYDSVQNEIVQSSYIYTFKDTIPFQKVKLYNQDKGYRLLYDYIFDSEGRLVREQVKPEGRAKKIQTVLESDKDLVMILGEYNKDTKIMRYYKNMYELFKTERTQYNDKGYPINTKTLDAKNSTLKDVLYAYEGDQFVKETHLLYNDGQEELEKTVYIRYNLDGIMEQLVTEIGNKQTVLTIQYYIEF